MALDDSSRSVSLQCSTCGGTQFEFEEQAGPYRCVGCERNYSREELMRENGARIEEEVSSIKDEMVQELRNELRKSLSGSKYFKLK